MCVHCQFSCAPKLARKYEIEHWSQSNKTINWSSDSFQINHFTLMSWFGHVILVSGYPFLTAVNWPYCKCPPVNRIALLSSFTAKRSKDSGFSLYLQIENPSKRSRASPRRKLKFHRFQAVKMCSKIHACQPETVPLSASFWLDVVNQLVK